MEEGERRLRRAVFTVGRDWRREEVRGQGVVSQVVVFEVAGKVWQKGRMVQGSGEVGEGGGGRRLGSGHAGQGEPTERTAESSERIRGRLARMVATPARREGCSE